MRRASWLVLASGFAVLACAESPTAPVPSFAKSENAPVHQVTGGGKLDLSLFNLPAETYGFSASVDGNGVAKGQMHVDFSIPDVTFHAEVSCLLVIGADAWLGGVVTSTHDETLFPVGRQFIVRVQDNGQGNGDPPDRMSGFFPAAASACLVHPLFPTLPWLHGNIQVK